jgi:hypothetical protein
MADTPHEKPVRPVNTENQSKSKHQEAPPVLRAELQIPHSIIDAYNTKRKIRAALGGGNLALRPPHSSLLLPIPFLSSHKGG